MHTLLYFTLMGAPGRKHEHLFISGSPVLPLVFFCTRICYALGHRPSAQVIKRPSMATYCVLVSCLTKFRMPYYYAAIIKCLV